MSRAIRMHETYKCEDPVDMRVVCMIYCICNDHQFEACSGSDFSNFINLKPTAQPVIVRKRENLRVCYMIMNVAITIKNHERAQIWTEGFLEQCGIPYSYYEKHRNDISSKFTTETNKIFRNNIDEAIKMAKELTAFP